MSAESDFLASERADIQKIVGMIDALLQKEKLSEYEVIALGKLLQDVYMGIERILRYQLAMRNITIAKGPNWHKDLLLKAQTEAVITEQQFTEFRNLLLFRHLQIHGYGFNLDEARLRELSAPISNMCNEFLANLD
jgi:uncharacterized protein YutE (UPF0331/DUF86 family)